MTVLKIKRKEGNFLILDKACLNESQLSWGAKGLHAYLMGLPADWNPRVSDLEGRATNGRDSVRGLLGELERHGFLTRETIRNAQTGKFSSLEYIVHETPTLAISALSPAPENPAPANRAAANPAPANPTLVNIDINKYQDKKILKAAAEDIYHPADENFQNTAAAAAKFIHLTSQSTMMASTDDAIIAETLTLYQRNRVESALKAVDEAFNGNVIEEVCFCLLSSHHFKACGNNFAKKLNAICMVIRRGEWQTPAEMIAETLRKQDSMRNDMLKTLREAHAEVVHFKRLASVKQHHDFSIHHLLQKAEAKLIAVENEFNKNPQYQKMLETLKNQSGATSSTLGL